jgi:hypothetical protein
MSSTHASNLLGPLLMLGAASLATSAAQAGEPQPLDEEFLDYLSQLEGDDDDWTLFDGEEAKPAPAPPAAAKPAPPKEPVAKAPKAASPKLPAEVKR